MPKIKSSLLPDESKIQKGTLVTSLHEDDLAEDSNPPLSSEKIAVSVKKMSVSPENSG